MAVLGTSMFPEWVDDSMGEAVPRKNYRVTVRGQWLGQRLRTLREANGMTLDYVAEYMQRNPGTMSRFETAQYPIRRVDVLALLDLYGVSDPQVRRGLIQLSEALWQKGWWDGYADDAAGWFIDYVWIESQASRILLFDNTLLPGLLQTAEYAEATLRAAEPGATDEYVERGVELRMNRQQVLDNDIPTCLQVVLDESLLHRCVGGHSVMYTQLHHLLKCADRLNVQLQVLPFNVGAHASPTGTFKIFCLDEPYPDVAYVETPKGAIYVESPETEPFARMYARLQESALGAEDSRELIAKTAEESHREDDPSKPESR